MNEAVNIVKSATANGRHISCKIEVGDITYFDDRILYFNLSDVTHPDWFTIGTTCSNEFSFKVLHHEKPELQTVVKPYVSFDGSEWFCLGIFYISRRYVRGKYATIVCYDKMNSLGVPLSEEITDNEFLYTDTLLNAVCKQVGINFSGDCTKHAAFKPKKSVTVRNVIGYIAAMNCACAKIDKSGALVFKKYAQVPDENTQRLSVNNCYHVNRNITRAFIAGISVNTGEEILRYGEHSGPSTIDLTNPFMTQNVLNSLGKQLRPLYFYGAEIKMQALPFLDSGEFIQLENANGTLTPLMISEIKYNYDGGFTAELYSKNKYVSDPPVGKQAFENEIAKLWEFVYEKHPE